MQSRDGTGLAHDKAAKRSGNFKERRLKLWPVYPIMVFMDPSTIVQSAGNQAASTIWMFIVISAVVIVAKLAFRRRKRGSRSPGRR